MGRWKHIMTQCTLKLKFWISLYQSMTLNFVSYKTGHQPTQKSHKWGIGSVFVTQLFLWWEVLHIKLQFKLQQNFLHNYNDFKRTWNLRFLLRPENGALLISMYQNVLSPKSLRHFTTPVLHACLVNPRIYNFLHNPSNQSLLVHPLECNSHHKPAFSTQYIYKNIRN
jgi:hypothetical protein